MPELKHAELIDGIVHIPGQVGALHGTLTVSLSSRFGHYTAHTPVCEGGANATWLMLDDSSQPSMHMRIPRHSRVRNDLFDGAPGLAVEVCETDTEVDVRPKLALYQRAGWKEYVTAETLVKRIQWRVLQQAADRLKQPDSYGIRRSVTFPGLLLEVAALWSQNSRALSQCLDRGVATPEHATL